MNIPRPEYPRPQFERKTWMNLNGEWEFSFDTDSFDRKINVPYAYQSKLSGIDIKDFHDVVWYRKDFDLPGDMKGKTIILNFGAVDYECTVWVNGAYKCCHTGGHTGFSVDITDEMRQKNNIIKLKVTDKAFDLEMPRGKQYWHESSQGIRYTRTTGIWQTVWIEALGTVYVDRVFITPDFDKGSVGIEYEINGEWQGASLEVSVKSDGCELSNQAVRVTRDRGFLCLPVDKQTVANGCLPDNLVWTPENPKLLDLFLTVRKNNRICDEVKSYFGLRKVHIADGTFMLNNRKYYQKLLLDQGYWPDSLLTAPTDDDFILDIDLSKKMGFNGVRKHQKIEDPRYLYHCDRLGFIVWGEAANAMQYSRRYVKRFTDEWIAALERDYNHPCIFAWTPINESWAVQQIVDSKEQQSHTVAMVNLTRSLDATRPVSANDGWEQTDTDILGLHDYTPDKEELKKKYNCPENFAYSPTKAGRLAFVGGWKYKGQPLIITEYGGISYKKSQWDGWGYSNATSDDDFLERYYNVTSALLESPLVQGFCYTQITDVEQEINGLLTYDRKPKVDLAAIKAINEGKWKP